MRAATLRDALWSRCEDMLRDLRALVEHESPSRDKPALDALAARIADRWREMGGAVERIENPAGGAHVLGRFGDCEDASRRPILVVGHYDTVWPSGTLATRPFRVEEGRAYGPGVFDMKASLILVEWTLQTLRDARSLPDRPIDILFTSDEEIGSPTSRDLIERLARRSECALIVEPPLPDGGLKTSRKGVGLFSVSVEGREAHAGVEPEKGVNAIVELARQIERIIALADSANGTTVNIGTIAGGTTSNVVPASAKATVDVRATSLDEARRITEAMSRLEPIHPEARIRVEGRFNRPPMMRTASTVALFEAAREVGREIGLDLSEGATGGGSDGNFTSAVGCPTLDGLGVSGAGAHAEHEHIVIDSLPERAALFGGLLLRL